jgi:uncharacterized protein YaeQ
MSFVSSFRTFTLDISNSVSGIYEKVRIKVPFYEDESVDSYLGRLIAFSYFYEPGLTFSRNPLDTSTPTFTPSHVESESPQVFVGLPDLHKFLLLTRSNEDKTFAVFFISRAEVDVFCSKLRGSQSNWIRNVQFFQLNETSLEDLTGLSPLPAQWQVTIVEPDLIYFQTGDVSLEIGVTKIEMWERYQQSIGNAPR